MSLLVLLPGNIVKVVPVLETLSENFFLHTTNPQRNPQKLVSIFRIKNEPSCSNITLFFNNTPIYYKIDNRAQWKITSKINMKFEILKNISPRPDLSSANARLSA